MSFVGASSATAAIVFPAPFAAQPVIVTQVVTGAGAAVKSTVLVSVLSAAGATVRVDLTAAQTMTLNVHWVAVEAS
ncbi:hypothetical protein [Micromonospora eburnea]|uniref:hypothetical protein n=1 Tax=Micromonospora eburnea TaxID=227316 RepID=UPI00114D15C8|nr:hypothetical protein [Micromonospora eburnea]